MASQLVKKSMRLFGLPYQFTKAVDPRINNISNDVINKSITESETYVQIPRFNYNYR